ncbi:hypothetical protein NNG48_07145 [Enterococcus faecium]|nr:hypothetical protein [Enterococcus faecium]
MIVYWKVTAVIRTTEIIEEGWPVYGVGKKIERDTYIDTYFAATPSRDSALRIAEKYFYNEHGFDKDVILVGATSITFEY